MKAIYRTNGNCHLLPLEKAKSTSQHFVLGFFFSVPTKAKHVVDGWEPLFLTFHVCFTETLFAYLPGCFQLILTYSHTITAVRPTQYTHIGIHKLEPVNPQKKESHTLTDNRGRWESRHPCTHNDFVVRTAVEAAGVF